MRRYYVGVNIACIAIIVSSIMGETFVWWIDVIGVISGIGMVNLLIYLFSKTILLSKGDE